MHANPHVAKFHDTLGPELIAKIEKTLVVGGGTHTIEDLVDAIMTGRMQLFVSDTGRSVAITEIIEYPRFRDLHGFVIAGDLTEIFGDLIERVKAFGVANGCKRLTGSGRHGWARAGTKVGFAAPYSTIVMPLAANHLEETP